MVHGRSTDLPGIIPKVAKKAAIQNTLQRLLLVPLAGMPSPDHSVRGQDVWNSAVSGSEDKNHFPLTETVQNW